IFQENWKMLHVHSSLLFRSRFLYPKIQFLKFKGGHEASITSKLFLKEPQSSYRNKLECVKYLSTSKVKNSGISEFLKTRISNALSSSLKIKVGGLVTYEKCADSIDYNEFFNYFKLPDTFQSWFLTLQLHVWICATVTVSESNGRIFRNRLIDSMWNDVELRLTHLKEIRSSARKKYLSEMVEQFQAALISYDEGLHSHDTVLAGAVWRTMFGFRPVDPHLLEALVLYIRKQIDHLDTLNTQDIMYRGSVEFLSLQNILNHVVSENTS
ncbi:ubiquinol-cytochrome c reductase complex chaperone CBP3-like protein, partial [Nephila pilipes]